jgi:hypothetical protein
MKKQRKEEMTTEQLKLFLKVNNIEVKQTYKHEDYMFTSFTMPYPHKAKLDRLAKKFGMTRSAFFRLMLDNVKEDT